MYLRSDGSLGYGDPHAVTYASHGTASAARINGRVVRGPKPPQQPVNGFLEAMREDWDDHGRTAKVEYVRGQLEVIDSPFEFLDPEIWGDCTLGELFHARAVLTRLLAFLADEGALDDF